MSNVETIEKLLAVRQYIREQLLLNVALPHLEAATDALLAAAAPHLDLEDD